MHAPVPWLAAALAVTGAAVAVPAAVPSVEPAPLGFTGGFGEESCVACHIGSDVNAFDGRVTVEGLPNRFEPGGEYLLTVILEAEGTEVAGFQVTSRYAEGASRGASAGVFVPTDGRVEVSDSAGVSYAHHTRAGSLGHGPDRASWSLVWTAPTRAEPVAIHVAANSGNGDNSPLSDLVYTAERLVPSGD